jgi:hypothetical protein
MESCRELKENNPYLFNSWRSILYTEKGRKAGVVDEWRKFPTFYKDVHETYKEGLRLCRKDKNKPFGPNNFQIPEYEGALVFDGVDDYGICEDFPALKDFTFVYKRINLNPSKSTNCFLSKSVSTNQAQQFCSELAYSQNIYVRLGGKDIAVKDIYNPELSIVYVTKESYNGEMNLASSNYTSTVDDLYIGTFSRGIQAYVWKGALYALDIYDRTLNSDELQIALQNIEK